VLIDRQLAMVEEHWAAEVLAMEQVGREQREAGLHRIRHPGPMGWMVSSFTLGLID